MTGLLPGRREWLFSVVTFAAAALALWIAFATGLERPYWAATTVYIAAQPSTGALRAKSLWRLGGTLAGGAFAVVAVPNLAAAPPLLVLAFACWVALCLAASLLDPTPRSYGFMLAGYTAGIIGFPTVEAPEAIFGTAILRMEEIGLGIACAWGMHALFLPRPATPLLLWRLRAWTGDLALLAADALEGDLPTLLADRRRLARDATALDQMFQQARYEPDQRAALMWLPGLRDRARSIPAIATAAADRIRALRAADPAALAALEPLLAAVAGWMRQQTLRGSEPLLARIAQAEVELHPAWPGLLREGLLARLRELVETWAECSERIARICAATPAGSREVTEVRLPGHIDPLLVGLSALAAAAAVAACCAFWILVAWPSGATMAMMSAVGISLFAGLDDPAPAMARFIIGVFGAAVVAGIYLFTVLPAIDGFVLLVFALGIFYLPVGALLAVPALTPRIAPLALNAVALMALQETYSASFPSFVESSLAMLSGFGVALAMTRLLRSFGVEWRVARLVGADRRDLARLATARRPVDVRAIAAAMLDRFEALAARLGTADAATLGVRELAELRAAMNLVRLRAAMPDLPPALRGPVEDAVAAAGEEAVGVTGPAEALRRLDRALVVTAAEPRARAAALALSGLRMALFPEAPPPAASLMAVPA